MNSRILKARVPAFAAGVVIAGVISCSGPANEKPVLAAAPSYSITSEIQTQGDDRVLVLTLTNKSSRPLTVSENMLPWGARYAPFNLLLAYEKTSGILSAAPDRSITDPGAGQITIPPGESVTGVISLDARYGVMDAVTERLLVFWSYELVDASGSHHGRLFGGHIIN